MTLENKLLERLAEWRPDSERSTLTVTTGEGQPAVAVTADHNDVLASRVWELALTRGKPVEDVKRWADNTCARVTGLLEPLRLIESDAAHKTAQLRSDAPAKKGEAVFYYEVLLRARGEANVRRFQAARAGGKRREQVPFALTHEVLAKLVDDLLAAS